MRNHLTKITSITKKTYLRILVILFLGLALSGCKSELYGNLNEKQVNEMIMVLGAEGINASRSKVDDNNFSLNIERSDFTRAISILSAQGLPKKSYETLGDVFKSDKIVSTPFEERARFMYAIGQELAQSITQIDGIVSSRVHITIPEETPFSSTKSNARASVFIYYAPNADITKHVPIIKNLITRSVDGLVYENVTVALFNSQAKAQDIKDLPKIIPQIPSSILPLIIFLLFSGLAFFVLSKFIWKPNNSELNTGIMTNQNSEKS